MKSILDLEIILLMALAMVLLAASGCVETPDSDSESDSVNESATYWPTEGWRTSTPERQGMDSGKLAELLDYIQEKDINIHSLLIIRNGYIVTDAYFYPFGRDSLHDLASATKSVTATLIGIANSEGKIKGVEQPVLEFFPERAVENVDANKKAMILEDLLTMRSGLECVDEPYEVTAMQMVASPNWIQFTLDLPMAEEPGTRFVYCSSNSHLLSGIISETTGMSEMAYANETLFGPLGISNVIWPSDPQANNHGFGDLHLTPHDMAKIGYLYLNNGSWDGKQIVPAEWVAKSTQKQVPSVVENDGEAFGYGYQWWISGDSEFYMAEGRGGQFVIVWPKADAIIVTTGGGFDMGEIEHGLIAAFQSDQPLPENPEAYGHLREKIDTAAMPSDIDPEPVKPLPEMANIIEGKTYVLDSNLLDLQSLSLSFDEENGEALLSFGLPDNFRLKYLLGGLDNVSEDQKLEYLLGLDNISRTSPGTLGLLAQGKGSWESSDVFVADIDETANVNIWRIAMTFQSDHVALHWQDRTRNLTLKFGGRLEGSSEQEADARNISTG